MAKKNTQTASIKISFSGKKIKRAVKTIKVREGSRREAAWNATKGNVTYEKFRAAGGNSFDLRFFVQKGYAQVA